MHLILASASKGRQHLFKLLKISFTVMPSNIDEDKIKAASPLNTINLRAKLKCESIIKQFNNLLDNSYLILSSDTEVILDNQLIGKPANEKQAIKIFQKLSGRTHQVITGVYIIKAIKGQERLINEKTWQVYDKSYVSFKKLTLEDIKFYLKYSDYTKYTGGYALFASPQDFIIKTEGSLSNIIGLPLGKVIPILQENNLL